jgi:hypothetical protein
MSPGTRTERVEWRVTPRAPAHIFGDFDMPSSTQRLVRRVFVPVMLASLLAGCREKTAPPDNSALASDSSLTRDLAVAQRDAAGPLVFNDAPAGAAAASPAASAPTPRPGPPRAATPVPRPRPTPRRASPAAVIAPTSSPTPQPAAAGPVPGPTRGVIGAGTRLGMTTNGRICAASALAGDKFTATVTSATTGTNGALIPAGATVVLEVASVQKNDPIENSRITFRVRAIDIDGVPRSADGDVATLASLEPVQGAAGNDRTKVIGGAVVGAILGRILGGNTRSTVLGGAAGAAAGTVMARRGQTSDACLPNGAPLSLTLSRDMVVPLAGSL